jgi:aspartyl-tRNA(Asn)/glutamyl-tRNA(Gln) amidotransferase subunit A
VAVKDLIDTGGLRTTYGSVLYAGHVPARDAPVVERLRSQGAIVIGKTNLNEFAYGVTGHNPHYGIAVCPADQTRTAGGSSGGSAAAVAAGVCDLGVGTDTSGSVRIPAACCNVYGFKAAHDAFSMEGIFPLAPALDSVGFFSADVATLALALDIAPTPDHSAIRTAHLEHDVRLPALPAQHRVLFRDEAYAMHAARAQAHPDAYGADVRGKLAGAVGDVDDARATMRRWRAAAAAALAEVDVAIGEVFPGGAPTIDAVLRDYEEGTLIESTRLMAHTPVANALGWPAMTVPTADGPRHLLGRPGSEPHLLAVAARMGLARDEVLEAAAR